MAGMPFQLSNISDSQRMSFPADYLEPSTAQIVLQGPRLTATSLRPLSIALGETVLSPEVVLVRIRKSR